MHLLFKSRAVIEIVFWSDRKGYRSNMVVISYILLFTEFVSPMVS